MRVTHRLTDSPACLVSSDEGISTNLERMLRAAGQPVPRGTTGELVLNRASIGMTKGLWRDPERYLDSYWRTLPGRWFHGDFIRQDEDGLYFIAGRSDDTIKVSGKPDKLTA